MIERICQQCGKSFLIYPSQTSGKSGHKAIFCSHECQAKARIGTHQSQETNRKKSEALSRKVKTVCHWCGKEFLVKLYVAKKGEGKFCSYKCYGEARKGKMVPWNKGLVPTNDIKRKIGEASQRRWQDPEFVKKILVAFHRKPTKPEMQLESILKKHFPQYQYNGDGRLGITLGGLVPDFPNVNGKKSLIEIFGDYWHSPEVLKNRWKSSELGRIMTYNSVGWECLVIWEHELKELTEEQTVAKIKTFHRRKYAHAAYL